MDINSLYYNTDYFNSIASNSDTKGIENSIGQINSKTEDAELMEACKSFESYFVEQVIKNAAKTVENEEEDGEYLSVFKDNLYQSYAKMISDAGTLGLAEQFYESIKRNMV